MSVNFDLLNNISDKDYLSVCKELYATCCNAEKFVYFQPRLCLNQERIAAELITKLYYAKNGWDCSGKDFQQLISDKRFRAAVKQIGQGRFSIQDVDNIRKHGNPAHHGTVITNPHTKALVYLEKLYVIITAILKNLQLIQKAPDYKEPPFEPGPDASFETLRMLAKDSLLKELMERKLLKDEQDLSKIRSDKKLFSCVDGTEKTFTQYLNHQIVSGKLVHTVLFAEGGSGKTFSMIHAAANILRQDLKFHAKKVLPVFIPAISLAKGESIAEYTAKRLIGNPSDTEIQKNALLQAFQGPDADTHFVFLIDGINESLDFQTFAMELVSLSHVKNTNLTLIASCKEADTLKHFLPGWEFITLHLISQNIIKEMIPDISLSKEQLEILGRPFYLKAFREIRSAGQAKEIEYDIYTILEQYIENHILMHNRSGIDISENMFFMQILNITFPEICYRMVKDGIYQLDRDLLQTHPFRDPEEFSAYSLDEKAGSLLVKAGILEVRGTKYVFHYNISREYFGVKYVCTKCADYANADSREKFKRLKEIQDLLDITWPAETLRMLAVKLSNSGLLDMLAKGFSAAGFSNNAQLQSFLISLYAPVSTKLSGLDLKNRNLWLSDFTKFTSLRNCDFTGTALNPETLWVHDTKVNYTGSNLTQVQNNLIFLSDDQGIEVYDLTNDNKLYISFEEELTYMKTFAECIVAMTDELIFCLSLEDIRKQLRPNTENAESKATLLNGAKYITRDDTRRILDILPFHDTFYILDDDYQIESAEFMDGYRVKIQESLPDPAAILASGFLAYEDTPYIVTADMHKKMHIWNLNDDSLCETTPDSARWEFAAALAEKFPDLTDEIVSQFTSGEVFENVCLIRCCPDSIFVLQKYPDTDYVLNRIDPESAELLDRVDFHTASPELILADINAKGNVLYYSSGQIFMYQPFYNDRVLILNANPLHAKFINEDNFFIEEEGVCKVFTPAGQLRWQKTILSVIPYFYAYEEENVIVEMRIPGSKRQLFFTGNYHTGTFDLMDTETVKLPERELLRKDMFEDDSLEGCDSKGCLYYRLPDQSLEIRSWDGSLLLILRGSALDFKGSVFTGATLANREFSPEQKELFEMFGGRF